MFGGSSPQAATPQADRSLLGGLFGGNAPAASGVQTGGSVLGGMFGGTAAAPPQAGGSILGGMFGGAASQTTTPQTASSILGSMFGGLTGVSQPAPSQTGGSLLGGLLPGAPSAHGETPAKGLLSMFGGPTLSPTVTDPLKPTDSQTADTASMGQEKDGTLKQHQAEVKLQAASSPKPDHNIDIVQYSDKQPAIIVEGQSKDVHIDTATEQPVKSEEPSKPEPAGDLCSTNQLPPNSNEQMPTSQSNTGVVAQQEKAPEPDKSILDSSADAVSGFMSSLFKQATAPAQGTQQQQKPSSVGGAPSQPPQTGGSLLGGIFGGATTQKTTPGSLLGGLFGGAAPQATPQTTGPPTGSSVLGGIFGGPTAKSAGPQAPGSLLGGIFGGSSATPATVPACGSLLVGGATAQTVASHIGAGLGGIGGSLFGGMAQGPQMAQGLQGPKPAEAKPLPDAAPQPENGESLPLKVDQVSAEENIQEVVSDVVPPSVKNHPADATVKEKTVTEEEEVIHEKPIQIKGEAENIDLDKSAPPDGQKLDSEKTLVADQIPTNPDPSQAKSLFGFMSGDAGKSLGSLLSSTPTLPTASPSMPQSDAVSDLFSGFKTFSAGIFQEEKPAAEKQGPPAAITSLFGAKISFPWQTEPSKPQAPSVCTSQPKPYDTAMGARSVHTPPAAQRKESVGCPGDVAHPQMCISTPELDPSASLSPKEPEGLVETCPSAGPTSAVQFDTLSKTELLSAKRPVNA
ncbi:hypothetical protein NHX12_027772 [Muraenolepis orangiensis]|uniref:Uncharacterized protein n=1 Tax=Muraenolepis orangiensis TaxID=630683 RepID=A0A9Q0IPJ9_9TELE|nr:hypothetical protein NHX12_027772 [Muraenolepis orangiensis]